MSAIASLLLAQAAAALVPVVPGREAVSEIGWECAFANDDGEFRLNGRMPKFGERWAESLTQDMEVTGDGPAYLLGSYQVSLLSAGQEYRRYRMQSESPDGVHYTIALVLLRGEDGLGVIDAYKYDSSVGRGERQILARANYCRSNFEIAAKGSATQ